MRTDTRPAFSLVEMLVVVGIIVLVTGMALPALMKARRAARATQCLENLHELGRMMHDYADSNEDYIPLGTSVKCPTLPVNVYRSDWSDFISAGTAPMSAMGPMLINGMITQGNAKLCYCPLEQRKELNIDLQRRWFPEKGALAIPANPLGIRISYSVRPEPFIWYWSEPCPPSPNVVYPVLMPKLNDYMHKALLAENPSRLPFNHGSTDAPAVNVLYQDGSARLVYVRADWNDVKPVPPWWTYPSAPDVSTQPNNTNLQIWHFLDRDYSSVSATTVP